MSVANERCNSCNNGYLCYEEFVNEDGLFEQALFCSACDYRDATTKEIDPA